MAEKTDKAKDAEKRRESERRVQTSDTGDRYQGWDAQQGALPQEPEDSLYADDPVVYSEDQLPDEEVLKEKGYKRVMPDHRIAGSKTEDGEKLEAVAHDGGPQTTSNADEGSEGNTEQPERDPEHEASTEGNEDDNEDDKDDDSKKKTVKKKSSNKKK